MDITKQILGLFPGQGSQKVGMGLSLFQNTEIGQRLFSQADEVLGFSLSKTCFEGPAERLNLTEVTQPAILTVSVICYELFKSRTAGRFTIAAAAGHSLGEYSALVAAGALRFEDAVLLVHKRGKFMQEAVAPGAGRMIAVLGREAAEIEAALAKVSAGIVQIANINAPGQIVVAGARDAVAEAVTHLAGAKVIDLPVSAPFHCPLMKPAEEKLAAELAKTEISAANFPVYSNFYATALTQPEEIREALRLQVCGQVRWIASMQNAIRDRKPELAVEFGYGAVLTGMLKRIDPAVARATVDSVEAIQKLG